jgi:hypothetical protein
MALMEMLNLFKNMALFVSVLFIAALIYLYKNQNKMIYMPEGKVFIKK